LQILIESNLNYFGVLLNRKVNKKREIKLFTKIWRVVYMEIKDVQANQGNVDIVAVVTSKDAERSFEKFGKQGRVCNAKLKDESGEISLTLWNEDIDKVKPGDKVHLQNGWCSEFKGERQLSSGKFGKIEVVEASQAEVLTNDPNMLQPQRSDDLAEEDGEQQSEEESDDNVVEEYVQ
jgi:replication factor A1